MINNDIGKSFSTIIVILRILGTNIENKERASILHKMHIQSIKHSNL